MASIKDQEKILNSLTHLNDLEMSDETLEFLRTPSTPDSARLDVLINLMTDTKKSIDDTNKKLDAYHAEQVQNQQQVEAWHVEDSKRHEEESKNSAFSNKIGLATLIATIAGIFIGGAITIGIQFLVG